MGYEPAPPTRYTEPTPLTSTERPHRMWGDAESGRVLDTIYVSNDWVHLVKFRLEPGAGWRDSDDYKTYFSAEVVYYILSGELFVADVSTGEVQRVSEGEALYVPTETWHHGFNKATEPLDMIEFIAPPPVTGSTQAFYKDVPLPDRFVFAPDSSAGPLERLRLIRPEDHAWRLDGVGGRVPTSIIASTKNFTVGIGRLAPGEDTGDRTHEGGMVLYVLHGTVTVDVKSGNEQPHLLDEADGFFLPPLVNHRIANPGSDQAEWLFEVAPTDGVK